MLNQVTMIGYVTNNPTSGILPSGDQVVSFGLVTTDVVKDKRTGDKLQKTDYHKVCSYRELARVIKSYVKKGDLIFIQGKMQYRKKDEQSNVFAEVCAFEMKLLRRADKQIEELSNESN